VLGEPPSLDPYSELASDLTYVLAAPVYRSLYRTLPDGAVESDLAESVTPEGRRGVLVRLRPARWSDGEPVTSRDVVRSVQRARYPSGFVGLDATVVDRLSVRLTGDVSGDWAVRLADNSFVVPREGGLRVGSGPFVVTRYVPGLEIVFERNRRSSVEAHLDRIKLQFIAGLEMMLALLEQGKLDAIAPPSAMNLDERLDEIGVSRSETLGRETIALHMGGDTDEELRSTIAGAIDVEQIEEGVVRDQGVALDNDLPGHSSGGGVEIQLGTASGDELLQLMQRVLQKNLAADEVSSELVQVDPATLYGEWETESPLDAALRREIVPGSRRLQPSEDLGWVPLFSVESFVAWNDGINGLVPHGGLEGPLWNAEDWWRD
jgi:ABC-type transport system substrate-binding protein